MKPTAWLKELVPEEGMEWQVKMTTVEEVAKDWEEPVTPLYPKKEWVGLTEDERTHIREGAATHHDITDWNYTIRVQQATELKLKEKNHA